MEHNSNHNTHKSEIDSTILHSIKQSLVRSEESVTPPDGAWEHFSALQAAQLKRRRVKRAIFISSASAAILLLAILLRVSSPSPTSTPIKLLSSDTTTYQTLLPDSASIAQHLVSDVEELKEHSGHSAQLQNRGGVKNATTAVIERPTITQSVAHSVHIDTSYKESINLTDSVNANEPVEPQRAKTDTKESSSMQPHSLISYSELPKELNSARDRRDKPFRVGINFAPSLTEASTNELLNYIGGVVVEYRISSSLSLSTGMQLEQQSLQIDNLSAYLVGLDIPLNFNWKFHAEKRGSLYFVGGVSSITYLKERYIKSSFYNEIKSQNFSNSAAKTISTYSITPVKSVEESVYTSPGKMELAGRLNLSVGYEQPLGPLFTIQVEPFIKIPLRTLTHQNLQMLNGGVAFKILF